MKKHKNPLPPLATVSFVAIILLSLIVPYSLSARTTTRSFPDIPWNGMKINVTATGNFVFGSNQDHVSGGGGSIAAYRNQENFLCSDGVINTITLSGNTLTSYNGNPPDFFHIQREISVFYYPAGSNEPTSVQETSQESNTLPLPSGLDWPFNITVPLPSGVDIGFQITLQVCEWGDPGHTYVSCKILNYDAITIDHFSGPDQCFQVEKFTPAGQSKNVDFDQPAITAAFTTPFDPDSINENTLTVFYWDKNGNKAYVDGTYAFSDDNKIAAFIPSGGLLDGVYYVTEVWGETDAKAANRSNWVKGANGGPLKTGKISSFWTMPDLTDKITVTAIQVVENAALVKGKPTVIKTYIRWDKKPNVSPDWQLKTLDANLTISWWENNTGSFDSWALTGKGSAWTPSFGSPIRREYLTFTTADESYNKNEKTDGADSVNYYGYTPTQPGTLSIKTEVEPSGQPGSKPRTFISTEASYLIKNSKNFRYGLLPIYLGDWSGTGTVVDCQDPLELFPCVNIQAKADQNHSKLQSVYPIAPSQVIRVGGLSQKRVWDPPELLSYSLVKSTKADWHRLMAVLSKMAQKFNYDALVGVLPLSWLGPFGVENAYYKKTVLIGHDIDPFVLAHEFGHMLGNFEDYASEFYVYNNIDASEGFNVPLREDRRPSVWSLSGAPSTIDSPVRHFMHADPVEGGFKLWAVKWQYDQLLSLFQTSLIQNIQSGEPLLLASGSIRISDNAVTVDPWYVLEPGDWTASPSGDYSLEFYNGSVLLSSQPFEVGPAVEGISRFILKVPYPAGTNQLKIKYGTTVLFSMIPSPTIPQLNITAPLAGNTWNGKQSLTWTASDDDPGSTLFSSVALSTDGGANWNPLTIDRSTGASNSFRLDTRAFPNSANCQVKISVSDGINTTTKSSGTFTINNAPRLVLFSPVSGAGKVKSKTPIMIGFSEEINPSTISSNTFYLKDPLGGKVEGFISYRGADREATFIPKAALTYNTTYTATVTTGIANIGGIPLSSGSVWSFTTEANNYPPRVVRFSPGAGDDRVSLNAALITLQFDKPMNPASLTSQSFMVGEKNGAAVSGQISYNATAQTALFRPSVNLSADTQYTVTLTSAVVDAQGNALASPFSWVFKTGSENTPWVRLTQHFKDYLWDQNGDGVWDTLVLEAEISVLFASTYNLSGWLLDKNGRPVARATTGNIALSGGTHLLSLYFSRQNIQNHGGEGPYYFADAILYDVLYAGSGDSLTDPYRTSFTNYTADADLILFAHPNPGKTGTPLTFQASVSNQGVSNATSVVLTATLPSSVDFISAASGQGSCTPAGGVVTCTIGTLGSLQSNLVSIVVTPQEKGWINFSASVTSVQDSYVANNNQQLSLEITTGGNLLYLPLILNQ